MIELFPFGMWHPHGINIIPTQSDSEAKQTVQLGLGLGLGKGSACTYVQMHGWMDGWMGRQSAGGGLHLHAAHTCMHT